MTAAAGGFQPVVLEVLVLRSPLLAFSGYREDALAGLLRDPVFRNALWLASPVFYAELDKKGFDEALLDEKKRSALLKYVNRACFRPTPFGAFASYSFLEGSGEGVLRPGGSAGLRLQLLPGRAYLVAQAAGRDSSPGLQLGLNPCLYRLGGEYRYVFTDNSAPKYVFNLNSLPAQRLNRLVYHYLYGRTVSLAALCERVSSWSGGSLAEAGDYVGFLMEAQFLITGKRIDLLEMRGQAEAWAGWQSVVFDSSFDLPAAAKRLAARAGHPPGVPEKDYFYVALERPLTGCPGPGCRAALLKACRVLQKLLPAAGNSTFGDFLAAFKKSYDQQAVPLLQALDPESGTGYGEWLEDTAQSPLLRDVPFPPREPEPLSLAWTPLQHMFLKVWLHHPSRGFYDPLCLTEADLSVLPAGGQGALPPSVPVLFRKAGPKYWLESFGGVTGTALLGRFTGFNERFYALCREIAAEEARANPGVVFAEIVQLSDDHVDNVNRRRQIYDHVIPLNGFCRVPRRFQVLPGDLLLAARGEELILWSRRLQKRVIPRLPTAYNFRHTELAIFRFLCDLAGQGLRTDLTLDLEQLFPGMRFYPRVEYEDLVLSPARWVVEKAALGPLLRQPRSLGRLHRFCRERGLPAQVTVGKGDQQLVFNLDNDWKARFFLDTIAATEDLVIQEYLAPDRTVVFDQQVHAGQFMAFLVNRQPVYTDSGWRPLAVARPGRKFRLGSDWLFLKIFCSPRAADQLLAEVVGPLVEKYRAALRSWFFIRYAEQGYHIRLRLQGDPGKLALVLRALEKALKKQAFEPLVKDLSGETYNRELERYHPQLIEMAESCFEAGSDWVIGRLKLRPGESDDLADQLAVFSLVYLMARSFLRDASLEDAFFRAMADRFLRSFGDNKPLKMGLDNKYRAIRRELAAELEEDSLAASADSPATRLLLGRVGRLAERARDLDTGMGAALLADIIHMQVNRHFNYSQLHYEAVIYFCLDKHRSSLNARSGGFRDEVSRSSGS